MLIAGGQTMQKVNARTVPSGTLTPMTQENSTQFDPVPEIYKHLNFKVPPDFHCEFTTFAASHDISMTALLIEAFNTLRKSQ